MMLIDNDGNNNLYGCLGDNDDDDDDDNGGGDDGDNCDNSNDTSI